MRAAAISVVLISVTLVGSISAESLSPIEQEMVNRGLEGLCRLQNRDGHWTGNGGQYPTAMTGMAAMAILMEGSTIREGRYSDNLRRAVDWLMSRTQSSGLIGKTDNALEAARYMYGHGFGMLFLANVYGEEDDIDRRRRLEKILTKAVEYSGKAQTRRGGWGYVSAADGSDFDEGSVTITQLQALRAAKNAGIVVPKSIIDNAVKYLKDCTTAQGAVIYSLANPNVLGGNRPPLTAAAICCSFSAGDYKTDHARKWLKYCQETIAIDKTGRDSFHWEYTHYYFSQVLYVLGDDRYADLFPGTRPDQQLRWSSYKEVIFDFLKSRQTSDGTWTFSNIGPVYSTACCLTMLQLELGALPIYQR